MYVKIRWTKNQITITIKMSVALFTLLPTEISDALLLLSFRRVPDDVLEAGDGGAGLLGGSTLEWE